ncbi:MAG TPA: dephospho-CoA kinase [Thermoanaerobaculia bacterium]|nr:dephospho-CoA kinase [Thermoanaerobaculia bacterium]
MSALRVGLTGGLASGKSTVARMLAERGATVIDADRLVWRLYEPGEPGARAAAELFGPEVLDAGGAVDRERLAAVVFADPDARRRLERAVHPLVRERFAEIAGGAEGVVVLEATLLVEAGYAPDFDLVVTVEADPEVRLRRAVARGMDEAEARRRLTAQGEGEARRAAADVTIRNDGNLAELERHVDALAERLGLA